MSDAKARGPAARRRSRAKKKAPIQPCRNVFELAEYEMRWLLYRAGEFETVDGVEKPIYSYLKIAKNFTVSRRFRISE